MGDANGAAGRMGGIAPEWHCRDWTGFSHGPSVLRELMLHAAFARNLIVNTLSSNYYTISDGSRRVAFWAYTPDTTSYVALRLSHSKAMTRQLLQRTGLNVPEGRVFSPASRKAAVAFARKLGFPVVVKPIHGSGGKGVTANIRDDAHFEFAWTLAVKSAPQANIIVEKHIPGSDYRLVVVGDHMVAASLRIPASIEGDGCSSIAELFRKRNAARQANPYLAGKEFAMTPGMERNMTQLGLDRSSVLESGRRLTLDTVANTGRGECVDMTEVAHPDFHGIAVRIAQTFPRIEFLGIDLIAEDLGAPAAEQNWGVCEVNTGPALGMQHFPVSGTPRDAAGMLMEHMFPGARLTPRDEFRGIRVTMSGAVRDIGFEKDIWKRSHLRSLSGWVWGAAADRIEAEFFGPPRAVESIQRYCRKGLPHATVSTFSFAPLEHPPATGFRIIDEPPRLATPRHEHANGGAEAMNRTRAG
jgi:D-alanine-D-alanine ligase-like ATP-grasp enzyme/acylphosphatase